MTKLFLRAGGIGGAVSLFPSDRQAFDYLTKLKHGDIVSAVIKKPRNPKHHRKLFAMLQLVWESTEVQDRYPKVENLLDAIKDATGHVETFRKVNGEVLTKPKSINFESMGQQEFEEFYAQAVDIIVQYIVPHLNREDLAREVEAMCR